MNQGPCPKIYFKELSQKKHSYIVFPLSNFVGVEKQGPYKKRNKTNCQQKKNLDPQIHSGAFDPRPRKKGELFRQLFAACKFHHGNQPK